MMFEYAPDTVSPNQGPEAPLPSEQEDMADAPTLKRVPALRRQTLLPPPSASLEDNSNTKNVSELLKRTPLSPPAEDVAGASFPGLPGNRWSTFLHQLQQKNIKRTAVIALLLVLIAAFTFGMALIFRQNAVWTGLTGQESTLGSSKVLLGLCIVLAVAFTVAFNIISRVSLSVTKYEGAYTVLWQLCCALLVPFFLPFDRFSINLDPHVLLLLALSVVLWALVDAFLFSAFKYEEASILAAIFPLNFIFTFAVSVFFFHSMLNPMIVVGFLIIMAASLLIGVYHTRLRPSKGVIFALLYSFFLGAALGFNSEVVKNFSIPPYMFVAYLFPALANLLIFLRPKVAELRYEFKVQWKKILLNAAIMDLSFFFLLKAFQLGNVPQVVAFSASSTLLTTLVGVVFLKEDKYIVLKIVAAALATLGIILVQL